MIHPSSPTSLSSLVLHACDCEHELPGDQAGPRLPSLSGSQGSLVGRSSPVHVTRDQQCCLAVIGHELAEITPVLLPIHPWPAGGQEIPDLAGGQPYQAAPPATATIVHRNPPTKGQNLHRTVRCHLALHPPEHVPGGVDELLPPLARPARLRPGSGIALIIDNLRERMRSAPTTRTA